jgi:peptidoglycan/LPS O-acetylase OafA/YrhL
VPAPAALPARAPAADTFRPDLEGLRGVAIALVILFHAGIPGASGGFVGVDVFFVLSGFLITGLLLRERERKGRVGLAAFYARRARRILPAALVILVVTLGASWLVLAPLDLPRVAGDVAASALSVGNIRFAMEATDYFGADRAVSPVLHYWSLGVEEQFYLVWPALLVLTTRARQPRAALALALSVLVGVSFVFSFILTDASPAWAFFSLPTRAWELGLGGLLAATSIWHDRLPGRLLTPLGWLGLGAILLALVAIDPATPYPGIAALLPALGTVAVIVAGARSRSVGRVLGATPLRFLGLISFSLYLVHWPLFVLPAANLPIGEELPLNVRLGLIPIAILLGWASYAWIERPFHRGLRMSLPPRPVLATAGLAVALTVAISVGAGFAAVADLGPDVSASTSAAVDGDGRPAATGAGGAVEETPDGAGTRPGETAGSGATDHAGATPGPSPDESSPTPDGEAAVSGPQPLPADVRPALARAAADAEPLEADGCLPGQRQVQPIRCVYGDPHGSTTVALVGDSHAAHWFAAIEPIAKERGWRLVPFIKLSCRFIDMSTYSFWLHRDYTECDQWKTLVVRQVKELKPDLVILSVIRDGETSSATDPDPVHQGKAMARLLEQLPGRIAIIVDTPNSRFDVPACVSRHRSDVRSCETARSTALGPDPGVVERTAAEATGATLIDLTPLICPGDRCPVVLRGMIVYRDSHHLTATFARSLSAEIERLLPPP